MQHDVLRSFSAVPVKWVTRVVRAAGLFEGEDVCGSCSSVGIWSAPAVTCECLERVQKQGRHVLAGEGASEPC